MEQLKSNMHGKISSVNIKYTNRFLKTPECTFLLGYIQAFLHVYYTCTQRLCV